MENYDVVIIGGGLGSLTTAVYLSRRLRNIALFEPTKKKKLESYAKKIKDDLGNIYDFKFHHYDLGGVHKGDLFYEYLRRCGLENKFEYYHNDFVTIVDPDKRLLKRPNNFDDFLIYLVRYYPKFRDQIHNLFDDITRHHNDFVFQKKNQLVNNESTIPSLLIEWGDLSLKQVLDKYFNDKKLQNEFTLVFDANGIPIDKINAYNYFIKWFDTFIDGAHFIKNSYNEIVNVLSREISKQKEKIFLDREISEVIIEGDKIQYVIDSMGNEIYAKHFVINMRIDEFQQQYFPNDVEISNKFYEMYPSANEKRYINQLYIGLKKPSKDLGILNNQYLFSELEDSEERILSLIDYKAIDNSACDDNLGAVLVEFIDDESPRKEKTNSVLNALVKYFPALIDNINVSRIGVKREYLSGVSTPEFWKNKTINDLFDIADYRSLNPFTNSYFIGAFVKPEAGITGIIQTGVEYGDIIDDLIYHGEDEETFITNDELMNIITHQFIPNSLGKREKNIQFFIGKESFYIRTKAKHLRLFRGVSDISDLIIIATNESLYDLSVSNTTLKEALKDGSFEYVGDDEFLDQTMKAFVLGQEINTVTDYIYVPGKYGMKLMLAMIITWMLFLLSSNYVDFVIVSPVFLAAFLGIVYFKQKKLFKINIFDYFSVIVTFIVFILSIFIKDFNQLHNSFYGNTLLSLYWLTTWLINKPVAFYYIKHDSRSDYTATSLFKTMAGGLTFIWGGIFLIIAGIGFFAGHIYSSLGYYTVILGLYLTYYYPKAYIKGNINK